MSKFLITYDGLILRNKPDSLNYRLNNYLISTEFCPNLNFIIGYHNHEYINGESFIYIYSYPKNFRNPSDNYCGQNEYMHKFSDISVLPKTLIDTSREYGFYIYDNTLVLTYPD